MDFTIVGDIGDVETIARGAGIREISRLRKFYGPATWRKRKGRATIRLKDGAEVPVSRTFARALRQAGWF